MKKSIVGFALTMVLVAVGAAQVQSSAEDPAGENAKGIVNQPASFPPPGEATRYVLPYYTSQTLLSGDRSVAVVKVYNQAKVSCNLTVEFQYATGITDVCSITLAIPGKECALFCSRPVADPLAPCSISCPAPGLTFNTGHAYVDSTYTIPTCANIAVDAQEVFTRDPADSPIESMSRLSIVKPNQPSIGD